MKSCPTCSRTYPDDTEFCFQDATRLTAQVNGTEAQLASGLSRRFRILRRLGAGGMGTVFLAEQIGVGNRPVALKVLSRKLLDDPEFLMRFQNEAASTGRIDHPNVVTIYESGQADDGTPYIAMQFLEGESLRETLKKRGALPVAECAEILQQTARGLNAAHKLGIIHRDLKPDNVFLTHGDEGELVVKLVDFGIAKLRESAIHTALGNVLGTPPYMSYEQAYGMSSDQLDARSDIYSLGIVVYEMLTGRVPFHSDTPQGYLRKHIMDAPPPFRAVAPGLPVPPQVEAAVMKALDKDRDQRFASALEFARVFSRAVPPTAPSQELPTTKVVVLDEAQVEQERQAWEKAEAERRAKERAEAERAAPERAEKERLERERAEAERRKKKRFRVVMAILAAAVVVVIVVALVWVYWLSPNPAQIAVQSSPNAQVYLDNFFEGQVSPQGRLVIEHPKPGDHSLRVSLAGKKDYQQRVTVAAGQVATVEALLADIGPPPGTVRENPKDGLKYVWIPPGNFMMGCSPGDSECTDLEKPSHQVTITRGFWIGQTDVTVGAYKRFAGATGRSMPPEPNFGRALNPGWGNEAMPIVDVAWDGAQAYCSWAGGRLPTEAEWEYAARGGSTEARYGPIDEVAWYAGNSGEQMHEVAQKRPNGFGLYDVLGNVWQWVNDWYDKDYYQGSPAQDPQGTPSGQERVLRGGSWDHNTRFVRVSGRVRGVPSNGIDDIGFRCGGEAVSP